MLCYQWHLTGSSLGPPPPPPPSPPFPAALFPPASPWFCPCPVSLQSLSGTCCHVMTSVTVPVSHPHSPELSPLGSGPQLLLTC